MQITNRHPDGDMEFQHYFTDYSLVMNYYHAVLMTVEIITRHIHKIHYEFQHFSISVHSSHVFKKLFVYF